MYEFVTIYLALRLFPDRHLSDRHFPDRPFPDLHRDIHIPRPVHRDVSYLLLVGVSGGRNRCRHLCSGRGSCYSRGTCIYLCSGRDNAKFGESTVGQMTIGEKTWCLQKYPNSSKKSQKMTVAMTFVDIFSLWNFYNGISNGHSWSIIMPTLDRDVLARGFKTRWF